MPFYIGRKLFDWIPGIVAVVLGFLAWFLPYFAFNLREALELPRSSSIPLARAVLGAGMIGIGLITFPLHGMLYRELLQPHPYRSLEVLSAVERGVMYAVALCLSPVLPCLSVTTARYALVIAIPCTVALGLAWKLFLYIVTSMFLCCARDCLAVSNAIDFALRMAIGFYSLVAVGIAWNIPLLIMTFYGDVSPRHSSLFYTVNSVLAFLQFGMAICVGPSWLNALFTSFDWLVPRLAFGEGDGCTASTDVAVSYPEPQACCVQVECHVPSEEVLLESIPDNLLPYDIVCRMAAFI